MAADTIQPGCAPANPDVRQASRRSVLAAMAMAPAALAVPALAGSVAAPDPRWAALVSDYHAKHADWLAMIDEEDNCGSAFEEACASLPPEPQQPGSGLPDDFIHMTLAEIKALGNDPAHKAAWAEYERAHAAWTEARKVAAFRARTAAFHTLTAYRVPTLIELRDKIAIVAADYDDDDIPQEYFADIFADVRHLAMEAAHG